MLVLELYCTIVILFLGVFAIIHSFYLPSMGPKALSPALFPMVIGILIFILSTFQIVKIIQEKSHKKYKRNSHCIENNIVQDAINNKEEENNLLIIVIMLFLYIYVLPLIHFVPSTLLFLVLIMTYVNKKITLDIVILSIAITISISYSFSTLFKLILP